MVLCNSLSAPHRRLNATDELGQFLRRPVAATAATGECAWGKQVFLGDMTRGLLTRIRSCPDDNHALSRRAIEASTQVSSAPTDASTVNSCLIVRT